MNRIFEEYIKYE